MPRRIPDYPDAFAGWNYVSSMGSMVSVIATCLFIYVIYNAYTGDKGSEKQVKNNPWSISSFFVDSNETEKSTSFATTLEFSVVSPTPTHVYNVLPILTDNVPEQFSRKDSQSPLLISLQKYKPMLVGFSLVLTVLSIFLKLFKIIDLAFFSSIFSIIGSTLLIFYSAVFEFKFLNFEFLHFDHIPTSIHKCIEPVSRSTGDSTNPVYVNFSDSSVPNQSSTSGGGSGLQNSSTTSGNNSISSTSTLQTPSAAQPVPSSLPPIQIPTNATFGDVERAFDTFGERACNEINSIQNNRNLMGNTWKLEIEKVWRNAARGINAGDTFGRNRHGNNSILDQFELGDNLAGKLWDKSDATTRAFLLENQDPTISAAVLRGKN